MVKRLILAMIALAMIAATYAPGWKLDNVKATYYGKRFHGRTTANGETYDMNALTAAHPRLPFGTIVRVVNSKNEKAVQVRINDRGPYKCAPKDRIKKPKGGRDCKKWIPRPDDYIDLSKASFDAICKHCDRPMRVSLEIVEQKSLDTAAE